MFAHFSHLLYSNFMTERQFTPTELSRTSTFDHTTIPALQETVTYFRSPVVQENATNGFLTLGMIKPSLHDAFIDASIHDAVAAEIVAKASIAFDSEAVNEFYKGGPYDSMYPNPPIRDPQYANRWEEYVDMMASGPSTILLLGQEDGEAVSTWRSQLGHWNIEANRDPKTIRGRYARDNHNNILHGSDSPESVLREMSIVSNLFERALISLRLDAQR